MNNNLPSRADDDKDSDKAILKRYFDLCGLVLQATVKIE